MPTINEYSEEPGYYIRARPSNIESPITYQVEPEGYKIIESYGLSHGDQISWSIIQSLKSLGLLFTNESGIIGSDEFDPDPEQLKETELDDSAAFELAEIIQQNINISPEELSELLSILGIDPQSFKYEGETDEKETTPSATLEKSNMPTFPVHEEISVLDGKTIFKTDEWWKAAIIAEGYHDPDILIYLWRNDGGSWKRKQKYKAKSPDKWENEKKIVDALVSNNL